MELQLKQNNCEILIRKKAALPQPPVLVAPPSVPQAHVQQQLPPASAPAPAAPVLPPPAPSKPKSSHPPMKCPMAGTFYRSPAPGAPPFVKVNTHIGYKCVFVALGPRARYFIYLLDRKCPKDYLGLIAP